MDNKIIQGSEYWAKRPLNDEKQDWKNSCKNWIEGYVQSVNHPHRKLIIRELKRLTPFNSVFEIGCSTGPNLVNIRRVFPNCRISGIEINPDAFLKAGQIFPEADLVYGNLEAMPDRKYDIILSDAVLMYINREKIENVMKRITDNAKKAIILVEWFDENLLGVVKDYHWARNYPKLLKGFEVKKTKLKVKDWPTRQWIQHGHIFTAVRQ